MAALSFTRIGGDEIRKAVGHELGHPHFVGTIDAFLFRYVVRPHLRHVFAWFADPRLVAGEWNAEYWRKWSSNDSASVGKGIRLFGCVCIGEENGTEVIAHKPLSALPLQRLNAQERKLVKRAKRKMWELRGLLTHSDVAFWATKILEHRTFGQVVRAEIVQRFPFLIVDELQDTGHFLGKSIRLLLQDPTARGVLVGDPDQAIYEFTGARPDLFDTFDAIPGARSLTLASSRRCPVAVTNVATHLKDSDGAIGPAFDQVGRALLLRYGNMVEDVPKAVNVVRASRPQAILKVIARGSVTVEALAGRRAENAPSLHCPALTHIHRAVVAFRRGRNNSALAAARAAIERAVFQYEGVGDDELVAAKIDPRDWKALAVQCLLEANAIITTSTSFDWHTRAGNILDKEIRAFPLEPGISYVGGKLKPQKRDGWNRPSTEFLPLSSTSVQALAGIPVHTVHGVKGETHDVTVFVCPAITQANRCPSNVWWSGNDKDREEKRIAYVAMTRTREDLIVCVSDACYRRLADRRASFVASFDCMTVSEFVSTLGHQT